jgi:hypothetical protein
MSIHVKQTGHVKHVTARKHGAESGFVADGTYRFGAFFIGKHLEEQTALTLSTPILRGPCEPTFGTNGVGVWKLEKSLDSGLDAFFLERGVVGNVAFSYKKSNDNENHDFILLLMTHARKNGFLYRRVLHLKTRVGDIHFVFPFLTGGKGNRIPQHFNQQIHGIE